MKCLYCFRILLAVLITLLIGSSSILADAPTGSSPNDPLIASADWQTLAPNTRLWFYFDYTGDRSDIAIYLDTNEVGNIELAILTPTQVREWIKDTKTTPIGRGSKPGKNTEVAAHDLVWLGTFNFPGRFFAVVTNNNPVPVSFRLTIKGKNVSLYPTPTPTPPLLTNPLATPVPVGTIRGKLVFQQASGGNIYVVDGDGSNLTRVTSGLDPAWSPDGTRIGFARWNEPAGLFLANTDGSNEQRIFNAPQVLSPRWSPDAKRIAFAWRKGGSLEDTEFCLEENFCLPVPADPFWKLGVVEVAKVEDGAIKHPLTEPPCTNHCFSPTWSSDNYMLAYADAGFGILRTDTRVGIIKKENEDKNDRRPWVVYNQIPQVQSASWSPDGAQIAFQVMQHDHWEIVVIGADGGNAGAVTNADPLSFTLVNNVAPTWSPDSKQILFLSDRNGKWEFFVANIDGSNLQQVLTNVTDQIPIRYNFSNERVIDWIR